MNRAPRSFALSLLRLGALAWLLASCATTSSQAEPGPAAPTGVSGAERLLALGDPVGAAQLLSVVGADDPRYAYAQELYGFAQRQAEAIAREWLGEIDGLVWEERYGDARLRAVHLLANFPLGDELRGDVERRLHEIEQGLTEARANLEELDHQSQDLLLMGSLTEAVQTLDEAYAVARQIGNDTLLERERVLMALKLRIAGAEGFVQGQAGASAAPAASPDATSAKKSSKTKRSDSKGGVSLSLGSASPSIAVGEGGGPASPAQATSRMRRLLASAQRYQKREAFFNAIVAYMKVRELDPQNAEAQAALEDLEPHRQVLISDLLDNANKHVINQDLEGAEPFFRKVLLIDPFNEPAMQGLQMFENLKRIRNEAPPPATP